MQEEEEDDEEEYADDELELWRSWFRMLLISSDSEARPLLPEDGAVPYRSSIIDGKKINKRKTQLNTGEKSKTVGLHFSFFLLLLLLLLVFLASGFQFFFFFFGGECVCVRSL
ncbi:hypothetical protein PanWU01x14_119750 [Parasponia andersonii]|uniref:Transmembrane protein n=1 Tax=Parasponia andersonii TaxID=3476 RepID=A0A2P5CVL5_PARAD|nr:hypothetical protein PanWU01x14_119750 [Parasponia andersonii]